MLAHVSRECVVAAVCPEVPLDLAGLAEAFATQRAAVGLLPGVDAQVYLQVCRLVEALEAHVAAVRPLARVDPLVLLELARVPEALATHATAVRLLLAVGQLPVNGHVPRAAEAPTAQRAVKRRSGAGMVGLHGRGLGRKLGQVSPTQSARTLDTALWQVPYATVLHSAIRTHGAGMWLLCVKFYSTAFLRTGLCFDWV